VDNQVQALQNQVIEGFSVHGSQLPDLEAEVLQIQLFCTAFSQLLDLSGSAGFGTRRIFFVPHFWATCLDYKTFLFMDFVYFVYPCPVETSRGSILLLWSFYTLFTLCPFETKMGSICLIPVK
jgi:hypothetical protein